MDVSAGNTAAAQNESTLTADQIATLSANLQRNGTLIDTFNIVTAFEDNNGTKAVTLTGVAHFSGGTRSYVIIESPQNGTWKVDQRTIR